MNRVPTKKIGAPWVSHCGNRVGDRGSLMMYDIEIREETVGIATLGSTIKRTKLCRANKSPADATLKWSDQQAFHQ